MTLSLPADSCGSTEDKIPRLELICRAPTRLPSSNGRLGVLGGAYNPITRAHLILARAAASQFNLHEVVFVLPKSLPNKPLIGATIEQRLQMMTIGVKDDPFISIGLCSHGLFLDISVALREVFPENPELFFITGRDAAERILTWPYANPAEALAQMFAAFRLLVFERQGRLTLPDEELLKQYGNLIHHLSLPYTIENISSTKVRQLRRAGLPIDDLVPAAVAKFIREHNLYEDLDED